MTKSMNKRKLLAFVISLTMVFTMMPTIAFADTDSPSSNLINFNGNVPTATDEEITSTTATIKLSGNVDYSKGMSTQDDPGLLSDTFKSVLEEKDGSYYSNENNPLMGRYTIVGFPLETISNLVKTASSGEKVWLKQTNQDMLNLYNKIRTGQYVDPRITSEGKTSEITSWTSPAEDELFGFIVGPSGKNIEFEIYKTDSNGDNKTQMGKIVVKTSALTFKKVGLVNSPSTKISLKTPSSTISDNYLKAEDISLYSANEDNQGSSKAVLNWYDGTKKLGNNTALKNAVRKLKYGQSKTYTWKLEAADKNYGFILDNLNVKSGSTKVTIDKENVTKIHTPDKKIYIKKGKEVTLPVIAYTKDMKVAKLTWKSSKSKVATVNSKGKVKAKRTGTATITAKAQNGKKLTVKVKVVKNTKKVKKMTIKGTPNRLKVGNTKYLRVKVYPSSSTGTVRWTSSKKSILTIDKSGKITPKKKGTVKITAKLGSKKTSRTIKVIN